MLQFILFADDTNVFMSDKSIDMLVNRVNVELQLVSTWFRANKLSLNLVKTNFILFRSCRKSMSHCNLNISIDNITITQVSCAKFLGVYVDEHLTWKEHIDIISKKLSKNIGIISRISYILPRNVLVALYYSLIFPYLSYCNITWASNYQSHLARLVILQKRAIRTICKRPYGESTQPLFVSLRILPFDLINKHQICIFMFRFQRKLLPANFHRYFYLNLEIHDHYTRSCSKYRTCYARTNIRQFSVLVRGPTLWNSLPTELTSLPTVHHFKTQLKRYFMESLCV
jgi:hypothetical protein